MGVSNPSKMMPDSVRTKEERSSGWRARDLGQEMPFLSNRL